MKLIKGICRDCNCVFEYEFYRRMKNYCSRKCYINYNRHKTNEQKRSNYKKHRISICSKRKLEYETTKRDKPVEIRIRQMLNVVKTKNKVLFKIKQTDITKDMIKRVLWLNMCFYCGKNFSYDKIVNGVKNPLCPSLDRVEPNLPYMNNNVVICHWECNRRKSNLTKEDMDMFSRAIETHRLNRW